MILLPEVVMGENTVQAILGVLVLAFLMVGAMVGAQIFFGTMIPFAAGCVMSARKLGGRDCLRKATN